MNSQKYLNISSPFQVLLVVCGLLVQLTRVAARRTRALRRNFRIRQTSVAQRRALARTCRVCDVRGRAGEWEGLQVRGRWFALQLRLPKRIREKLESLGQHARDVTQQQFVRIAEL